MNKLLFFIAMGILLSCRESAPSTISVQTSEDSTYAKEFIKKAHETQGLLLPKIAPLIKNNETAIAVAEAILFPIYGEENIRKQKPYMVYKKGTYWVLSGTLPEVSAGGVFEIAIDARDARVIGLTDGK